MTNPEREGGPPGGETGGFQMSSRRAVGEAALIVSVLVGAVVLVFWIAGRAAALFTDDVPVEFDRTLGENAARMVALTARPCATPDARKYVESVAAPLLAALHDPRFRFQFVVVDDPEVNAFALPGGFVTVNRGLLESAGSGEEVAAVLAHELTHVTRRHGTTRMLRELGAGAVLSAVFGGTSVAIPTKTLHDFLSNAYDRDQESEADAKGLDLLVRAGIDPRGMSTFFDRLERTGVTPPALLSTHPDPGDRAAKAAAAAKAARVTVHLSSPKGLRCVAE